MTSTTSPLNMSDAEYESATEGAAIRGDALNTVTRTTMEIERLRVLEQRQSDQRLAALKILLDAGYPIKRIARETGMSYTRVWSAVTKLPGYVVTPKSKDAAGE